ncbi:MAG: PLDc N-terminal domain-containing protein [bacterium]|nr:PLDc N-terminal domain-containing protein [bacterium]
MVALNIIKIILSLSFFLAMVGVGILWIYSIISLISRTDIKNNRILWMLVILALPIVGMLAYFFIENKRRLGWISLLFMIWPIVVLLLYGILIFIIRRGILL